jgi:hypothetical protein
VGAAPAPESGVRWGLEPPHEQTTANATAATLSISLPMSIGDGRAGDTVQKTAGSPPAAIAPHRRGIDHIGNWNTRVSIALIAAATY